MINVSRETEYYLRMKAMLQVWKEKAKAEENKDIPIEYFRGQIEATEHAIVTLLKIFPELDNTDTDKNLENVDILV